MAKKSPKNPPKLMLGSIVSAEVCDPYGTPAGRHFAVVLTAQEKIDAGHDLRVAVISTSIHYPLRDGWFALPHSPGKPGGHDHTGLSEACAVKGTWLQVLRQDDIEFKGKRAPVKVVRPLQIWLSMQREKSRRARTKKKS